MLEFTQESELMEISLSGDNPKELAEVVNAVDDAYMDEVVNKETEAAERTAGYAQEAANRRMRTDQVAA